jgi:hypothetical protein
MIDSTLLFFNGVAITTTGTGGTSGSSNTKAITNYKSPGLGQVIGIHVTTVAGSTTGGTIQFALMGSADDSTYVEFGRTPIYTNAAVGRYFVRTQHKYKYMRLDPIVGTGTAFSATVYAGIVSGGQRDSWA